MLFIHPTKHKMICKHILLDDLLLDFLGLLFVRYDHNLRIVVRVINDLLCSPRFRGILTYCLLCAFRPVFSLTIIGLLIASIKKSFFCAFKRFCLMITISCHPIFMLLLWGLLHSQIFNLGF